MATASLANPRLRLDRADDHLETLYPAIQAYMGRSPYLIPNEPKREGEWLVQRIFIREYPDPAWSVLLSEVVHHLRAALDNLVWQLVVLNDAEPFCRSAYPVRSV